MSTEIMRLAPQPVKVKVTKIYDGVVITAEYPNGYTASVARHEHSYGSSDGLWEVAVKRDGEIVYDTPITSDVLGYLNDSEVHETVVAIASLPVFKGSEALFAEYHALSAETDLKTYRVYLHLGEQRVWVEKRGENEN